jgi:hypothetical protein
VTETATRSDWGRQGSAIRHSAESYARAVVRRWPDLDEERRALVLATLKPILDGQR